MAGGGGYWSERAQELRALPAASARTIEETIGRAALRFELTIAAIRLPFFAAILVRFLLFSESGVSARVLTVVPLSIGIAYSLIVLAALRRPPRSEWPWLASVSIDAVACFSSLLANALWPAPGQTGILFMPDTAIVLVVTVASGLRLSRAAALWGSALNLACLLALVGVDRAVSGPRHAVALDVVSLTVIFMVGSSALAVVLASATRRLARRSALEVLRAERAERGLGALLSDHHDVCSLITSSIIDSELLAASAPDGGEGGERRAALAVRLHDRLRKVGEVVTEIKTRALGDLNALREPEPVDVVAVARAAVESTSGRRAGAEVRLASHEAAPLALVAGGAPALLRVFVNLLDNALAGDGGSRATAIALSIRSLPDLGLVEVAIEDDGPGFAPDVLGGDLHHASAKPGGLGVGLSVVRGLVEASGGVLRLANRQPQGASAIVRLRSAPR